jgi:hypothetical protein
MLQQREGPCFQGDGKCTCLNDCVLERAFSHSWLLLNITGANWAAMGDAERTKDRQKVGDKG